MMLFRSFGLLTISVNCMTVYPVVYCVAYCTSAQFKVAETSGRASRRRCERGVLSYDWWFAAVSAWQPVVYKKYV